MVPQTRSKSFKTVNWLFVGPENGFFVVHKAELTESEFLEKRLAENFLARIAESTKVELSPNDIFAWVPKDPLAVKTVGPLWANESAKFLDEKVDFVQFVCKTKVALGEDLNRNNIHIIFTRPPSKREREEADTLSELPPHQRLHERYKGRVGARIPSPSSAAETKIQATLQAKSNTVIWDGFYNIDHPKHTSALPLGIYHPVFQRFLERIPHAEPSRDLVKEVHKLMSQSTGVGAAETFLAENLRQSLSLILGQHMDETATPFAKPDGVILARGPYPIPLVVMEYKRALGEGGCDPSVQGSYSTRKLWCDNKLESIRDKCSCPSFIIGGGGPYIIIMGAVFTENFIVQRLIDMKWIGKGQVFEDEHAYRLAQVFESLRIACVELEEFYTRIRSSKVVPTEPHPRFFPSCTQFINQETKELETFEYIEPLTLYRKAPFLVRLKSGKKAVVKFVARYGVAAHQALAGSGQAPNLLFFGSLDGMRDERQDSGEGIKKPFGIHLGPPRMVVMEWVDGAHGEAATAEEKPGDAYEQVKSMVENLHNLGFVFGDLRPPNVVFREKKAYLVDFDWAGKHGDACYPLGIGEAITKFAPGAEDLEPIEKEHDLQLLEHYFKKM